MKKAFKIEEIDAAVNKFEPVTPDHDFYVSFENVRGDYQERNVFRIMNVIRDGGKPVFNAHVNRANKTLLFLAGMRGSGKTSELAKYAKVLNVPECFFVVTCNVDEQLDMDNVEYMDILVFQLEQLLLRADKAEVKMSQSILTSMEKWFESRVTEINRTLKAEGSAEMEADLGGGLAGIFGKLLGLTAKLKLGLSGSYERAVQIRQNLKNRFSDFSIKFNTFIEQANEQIRKEGKGQEILFIVDGLEKTFSAETRQKIIMEESNRIRQIKANTIFTLPIELMKEEQRIRNFSEIVTFPFIKICDRKGDIVPEAYERFREFVLKRIDERLFDSMDTVDLAIGYSGGSPRQLLRILEQAAWLTTLEQEQITRENLQKACEKLGNSIARYLEPEDFEVLRKMKTDLDKGTPIGFDSIIQGLLEKEIIFEYNDGTYKRVNPLLELSSLYRHHIPGRA